MEHRKILNRPVNVFQIFGDLQINKIINILYIIPCLLIINPLKSLLKNKNSWAYFLVLYSSRCTTDEIF